MNTRLEQFINDNREAFDSEEMNKTEWDETGSKNKKTGVFQFTRLWWTVAASIVLLTGIYYIAFKGKPNNQSALQPQIILPSKELTDAVDTSYTNQMDQFVKLIKIKQSELRENKEHHPQLYQQFIKDIDKLDSSYRSLNSALPANPNREMLLDAMVQNLQLRIELLNRQLQILKQVKPKNTDHEKKTI